MVWGKVPSRLDCIQGKVPKGGFGLRVVRLFLVLKTAYIGCVFDLILLYPCICRHFVYVVVTVILLHVASLRGAQRLQFNFCIVFLWQYFIK